MDKLLIGNFEEIPAGTFCKFNAYRDKSSDIELLPVSGIISKYKQNRSPRKAIQEFASLQVWHDLLETHGEHTQDGLRVSAPAPIALDVRSRIYMNLMPGVTAGQAISGDYTVSLTKEEKRHARLVFAEHMGRLLRIKEKEHLAHGDFQLRHVLFNPPDDQRLSVIDVEHSHISQTKSDQESKKAREAILGSLQQSARWKKLMLDSFDKGYDANSQIDSYIGDVVESVKTKLNLPDFKL